MRDAGIGSINYDITRNTPLPSRDTIMRNKHKLQLFQCLSTYDFGKDVNVENCIQKQVIITQKESSDNSEKSLLDLLRKFIRLRIKSQKIEIYLVIVQHFICETWAVANLSFGFGVWVGVGGRGVLIRKNAPIPLQPSSTTTITANYLHFGGGKFFYKLIKGAKFRSWIPPFHPPLVNIEIRDWSGSM